MDGNADRMNEAIKRMAFSPTPDGLQRVAIGHFDLRGAAEGKNLRQLLLNGITRNAENVGVAWQATVIRPCLTDTEVSPPRYLGDRIAFYWSRAITKTEALADLTKESDRAIDAAIKSLVAAGYDLMEYPD